MTSEKLLKDQLYRAFYWYYRHEYAKVLDLFNEENHVKVGSYTTKKAEDYAMKRIQNLISTLEGAIYE